MTMIRTILTLWLAAVFSVQAAESITISSETGDTLLIHPPKHGEIWASFMITDQVFESFAMYELIVVQVDQHQPIKLDHQKLCGGGKSEDQQVTYDFASSVEGEDDTDLWQFSSVQENKPDLLKLAGWDKASYQHMRSDRRPEVVDFALQGELAVAGLWQQFVQGEQVMFRYTTGAGEVRQAQFNIKAYQDALIALVE